MQPTANEAKPPLESTSLWNKDLTCVTEYEEISYEFLELGETSRFSQDFSQCPSLKNIVEQAMQTKYLLLKLWTC